MLRHVFLVALIAATPSFPALADDTKTAGAAADTDTVKVKKVCRRQVATGSVMPKAVCRTKAEWDELAERAKHDLERTQNIERSRSAVGTARGF